jgi:hypothetical protein
MMVDDNVIRTADERAMRRLVRRGARILAEYNWQGSGVAELEARGREWIVQLLGEGGERAHSALLPSAKSADKFFPGVRR